MTRFPRPFLLALLFAAAAPTHAATVVPLNDTGQSLCYDSAGATVTCTTTGADDGRYGRDAANTAGQISKTGAGTKGFDFTKIANDGSVLAAGVALGSNPTEWACTRDNVTGLTWEVKTDDNGLRDKNHTYTWYSTNGASNGGNEGTANGGTCTGSTCDTESFVNAVNAGAGLCGATDWRLPSLRELQSLVDFSVPATGVAPTIDATYFPNTQINWFWSANNYSSIPAAAWLVVFFDGSSVAGGKPVNGYVRLVRGGQ